MKHLDLCSGIGGFALAARWMGWHTIGFAEINLFASKAPPDCGRSETPSCHKSPSRYFQP